MAIHAPDRRWNASAGTFARTEVIPTRQTPADPSTEPPRHPKGCVSHRPGPGIAGRLRGSRRV